jgi:hypothetical protein
LKLADGAVIEAKADTKAKLELENKEKSNLAAAEAKNTKALNDMADAKKAAMTAHSNFTNFL